MPSIAIIGAGPAGLTLARLVLVNARIRNINDLSITIFENDANAKSRFLQGGTLDLHPETGIAALKAAHMWDDILPRMRYEGEELTFADKNATTYVHISSSSDISEANARPEVDREVLKDYLLKAVLDIGGEDIVRWGKHLESADGETGLLKFRDGTEEGPFDLVVGSEGAWSHVRDVLTDVKPSYSGVCGFEAWLDEDHADGKWEEYTKFVGKGSYFAFSEGKSWMGQRMENGSIKMSFWVSKEESWPADVKARCDGDDDKIRDMVLGEFKGWDEQYMRLARCSWHWRPWPLYELPIGHSWTHRMGWTLIGDASHVMTPFAGEGVNAAMKDALMLATGIEEALKGKCTLDEAVEKFEKEMFPRSAKVQGETMRNKLEMIRADAPLGFMANIPTMAATELGYDPTKGWVSWVIPPASVLAYAYFWVLKKIGSLKRLMRGT